jgi:Ca2+-binding EF-hand superfamily protein
LHRAVDLNSAYKAAISELSYALSSGLLSKRDLLLAQVHRISHRMDEISYVRNVIEKDIKTEFGGIVDRLKNAEGKKVAVIQNEMSHLQADIEKIDAGVAEYDRIHGDKVEFLLRSRSLREDIEGLLLKSFKREIDQTPYDLPRELKELRERLDKKKMGTELLKMKDEIIWRLFNEKKVREEDSVVKFNQTVSEEIASWAKLTDKYSEETKKYQLICYFCAEPMNGTNINKNCKVNEKKALPEGFTGFTIGKPEPEFVGNIRHFFARPKPDLFSTNAAFSNLQNLFSEQQTEMLKRGMLLQIEKYMASVKKNARERNINVENLLRAHDKEEIGMMSKAKFTYLLNEKLGVTLDKITAFLQLLDPNNKGVVNYKDFIQLLNDPALLQVDKEINGVNVAGPIVNLMAGADDLLSMDQSRKLLLRRH